VAFLRFSRDKRGVENYYLVHSTTNRRGKVRPRVLYWYRSPPDVKVGREPFDPDARRALEAQNPDVIFDWRAIVETPIPSADVDKWRERRRAERAAKHAAAQEESAEAEAEAEVPSAETDTETPAVAAAVVVASGAEPQSAEPQSAVAPAGGDANRKRRRRRRGGRGGTAPAASTPPTPSGHDASGD
jgi:hypothetical protein